MRIPSLIILVTLFFAQAFYSRDLEQRNPESLFLTDSDRIALENYKRRIPSNSKLIALKKGASSVESYEDLEKSAFEVKLMCKEKCSVLLPHNLYPSRKKFNESLNTGKFYPRSLIESDLMGMVIFTDANSSDVEKAIIGKLDGSYRLVGHGHINSLLDSSSLVVQERIFPIVFILSFIFIFFITRNIKNSLILFFAPLFSSLMSLSFIKFFYVDMNMVTAIVPLITFIISLSISLHLYYTSEEYKSFKDAFTLKKKPIYLMIITTFIGFLSLYVSEIQVIRHFGVLCATLIALSSFVAIVTPLLLDRNFTFNDVSHDFIYKYFPKKTLSLKIIMVIFFVSVFGGLYGVSKIKVVTDASNYFIGNREIRENLLLTQKLSGGVPLVEIVINKDEGIDFSQMKKISSLEKEILKIKDISIHSQLNSVREINRQYSNQDTISDNKFSFLALNSKVPESLNEDLQENYYRITVLGPTSDVDHFMQKIKALEILLKGHDYSFNGLFYNLMTSQKEMIHTLFLSFFISLICMSLIVLYVFKKLNIFFSFLLVNLCPVGITLFLFPLFGLSFNIATVMTYSIGLGIVVDSSFHIYHCLLSKSTTHRSYYMNTARPIISSSALLCFCFGLFSFYNFLPIREFGINLSLIIFLGLIFDLFVLPTLFLKNNFLLGESHENL